MSDKLRYDKKSLPSLPDYALAAIDALESEGFEAWCVGGCVRDALLHRPVNDYDIATSASWEQSEKALHDAGFTVHRTGTKHGTVTATLEGNPIEVTTFRADGTYSDGRHPDTVEFVRSIEEDLARRDFTVNALAYHPQRGLLDCHGGLDDLACGAIRTVGDPAQRFAEDGLRVLRGCRFASQLGFRIEDDTLQAMISHKMMLTRVSSERITHELDGMILGDYAHDALMDAIDVIVAVMPEITACKGFDQHSPYHIYDVWEHTAWVVQRSPHTRLARWAALLHDIGKPSACFFEGQRAHFFGHARISALLAQSIMERLSFAPSFVHDVVTLVRLHDNQIAANQRSVRRALAQLDGNTALFKALIDLKRADALAHSERGAQRVQLADDLARVLGEIEESRAAFTVSQLAVNGRDVLDLGVSAGPEVGAMLQAALDAVIDEQVPNEKDALVDFMKTKLNGAFSPSVR